MILEPIINILILMPEIYLIIILIITLIIGLPLMVYRVIGCIAIIGLIRGIIQIKIYKGKRINEYFVIKKTAYPKIHMIAQKVIHKREKDDKEKCKPLEVYRDTIRNLRAKIEENRMYITITHDVIYNYIKRNYELIIDKKIGKRKLTKELQEMYDCENCKEKGKCEKINEITMFHIIVFKKQRK